MAHRLGQKALMTTAALLAPAAVPVVPIKGIALAEWIYRPADDRPLRDVDLLISPTAFAACLKAMRSSGHPVSYASAELGEICVAIDGFPVELHGHFGRRELTSASVDEVLGRANPATLFACPILRIDDVDHLLLLAVNVVKDGFVWSNPHQVEDLKRMLEVLAAGNRIPELLTRARQLAFMSGLHSVASWMAEAHGSAGYERLLPLLHPRRRTYSLLARAVQQLPPRYRPLGLLLGCWTNDRLLVRTRATARLVHRGALRALGRTPG